jgi:hypothetical protein
MTPTETAVIRATCINVGSNQGTCYILVMVSKILNLSVKQLEGEKKLQQMSDWHGQKI